MDRNISIPKVFMAEYVAHRGYYMAVRRYEISLLVLKIFHSFAALTREIFFNTRREISYLQAAM